MLRYVGANKGNEQERHLRDMAKVKIYFNGEDLTEGKGIMINLTAVREIERQGLIVVLY